jgi:hypothetical protein
MATDWDEVDEAITAASKRTDAALASKVSSLTRLTDEEVRRLFPKQADVAKLAQLMGIVRERTSEANRINKLAENMESVGSVILRLLDKFV